MKCALCEFRGFLIIIICMQHGEGVWLWVQRSGISHSSAHKAFAMYEVPASTLWLHFRCHVHMHTWPSPVSTGPAGSHHYTRTTEAASSLPSAARRAVRLCFTYPPSNQPSCHELLVRFAFYGCW